MGNLLCARACDRCWGYSSEQETRLLLSLCLHLSRQRWPIKTNKQTNKLILDCGNCMGKKWDKLWDREWLVGEGGPGKPFPKRCRLIWDHGHWNTGCWKERSGWEQGESILRRKDSNHKGLEVGPALGTQIVRYPRLPGGQWGSFLVLELPSLSGLIAPFFSDSLTSSFWG